MSKKEFLFVLCKAVFLFFVIGVCLRVVVLEERVKELTEDNGRQVEARKEEARREASREVARIIAAATWASKRQNRPVTATAYTASVDECDDDPRIGAAGKRMRPGFIAVSRDLAKWGAGLGQKVRIEDEKGNNVGIFTVADFLNKRYTERIDFFFGEGADAKRRALDFGVRKMHLYLVQDIEDSCSLPVVARL